MREEQNFLLTVDDSGAINAGVTYQLDLESIKNEFGHNFNTLTMITMQQKR